MEKSNIITAFQYLKMAIMHFEDLQRELPNTNADKMAKKYISKIDWVFTDFISNPFFSKNLRDAIRADYASDVLAIPEILNKLSLLNESQRLLVEEVATALYKGEEIIFEEK
jgi:hypothetical protein